MILNLNKLAFVLVIILGLLFWANPVYALPAVGSKYYCLVDRDSGQVILSKGADEIRPVASTTKMMTAILAEEYCDLNEIAIVSKKADKTPEFTIGLRENQQISIDELLKAALVRSANDAAVVIAEHVAGDERLFGHLMSKKAFLIGAVNTHFVNASGLPCKEHCSTAYDLAQIGRYLLSKEFSRKVVASVTTKFKHPGYSQPLTITNTNGLLDCYKGADGIKTGTTDAAGKCLVASAARDRRGLIAVVLRSADRKGDCIRLLDYGFNNTHLAVVVTQGMPFKQLKVINGESVYVDIYPAQDLSLWVGENTPNIEKKVKINYAIEAPVVKGEKVGSISIYADDKYITTIDLVCGNSVARKTNLVRKLFDDFI